MLANIKEETIRQILALAREGNVERLKKRLDMLSDKAFHELRAIFWIGDSLEPSTEGVFEALVVEAKHKSDAKARSYFAQTSNLAEQLGNGLKVVQGLDEDQACRKRMASA